MANKKYNRKTSEERLKQIKDLSTKAYDQILSYTKSEEDLKEYADFMSKFYHYSLRNNALIQNQFSGAIAVASFKDWKDAGYTVNKGERGIQILAFTPITKFKTDSGEVKNLKLATKEEKKQIKDGNIKTWKTAAYSLGHVFDVSQTNAQVEDLPKIFPNRQYNFQLDEGSNAEHLQKGINAVAQKLDIEIKDMKASEFRINELGAAKGMFVQSLDGRKEIIMNSRNTETQHLATSIHELAHAKLHDMNSDGSKYSKETKEFQAELTSYIVSKHYGMDTSEKAIPYMASWTKQGDKIEEKQKVMEEVHKTSSEFIKTIDEVIGKEREKELTANKIVEKEYPIDHTKVEYCHMSGKPIAKNETYHEVDYGTGKVILSSDAMQSIYSKEEREQLIKDSAYYSTGKCKYEFMKMTNVEPPKQDDKDYYYYYDGKKEPVALGNSTQMYEDFRVGKNKDINTKEQMQDMAIIKKDDKESFNMFMSWNNIIKNPNKEDFEKINKLKGNEPNKHLDKVMLPDEGSKRFAQKMKAAKEMER